jgi:hypothetical protein
VAEYTKLISVAFKKWSFEASLLTQWLSFIPLSLLQTKHFVCNLRLRFGCFVNCLTHTHSEVEQHIVMIPLVNSHFNFYMFTTRTTDIQRELFFQKFETFGLGQTDWAEILGGILAIFSHYFVTVSPLFMGKCSWIFFLQKTLVFGSKTYNSQIQALLL